MQTSTRGREVGDQAGRSCSAEILTIRTRENRHYISRGRLRSTFFQEIIPYIFLLVDRVLTQKLLVCVDNQDAATVNRKMSQPTFSNPLDQQPGESWFYL